MRSRRARGFTLIEVMVSLGIMTIGAMAIMALLAHIMRANAHSRQMNTALNIGQMWVDRLKQDGHSWIQPAVVAGTPTVAQVLVNTLYLRNVTSPPTTQFITPSASSAVVSAAFNYQGQDLALPLSGDDAIFYCVAYRANWIYFGSTMRVDVRVFWPRANSGANIDTDWPNCDGAHSRLDPPSGTLLQQYHVAYFPTAISVTPVPR